MGLGGSGFGIGFGVGYRPVFGWVGGKRGKKREMWRWRDGETERKETDEINMLAIVRDCL